MRDFLEDMFEKTIKINNHFFISVNTEKILYEIKTYLRKENLKEKKQIKINEVLS